MLKMRSSRKTDLKNWPNISNVRFELTIDFTKDNEKSEEEFFRYDGCPGDKVDNIFRKSILDVLGKHRILHMRLILGL